MKDVVSVCVQMSVKRTKGPSAARHTFSPNPVVYRRPKRRYSTYQSRSTHPPRTMYFRIITPAMSHVVVDPVENGRGCDDSDVIMMGQGSSFVRETGSQLY